MCWWIYVNCDNMHGEKLKKMSVVVVVVREQQLALLSSSSRLLSYIYCVLGIAWGSELVCYLKLIWACVCSFSLSFSVFSFSVLSLEGVPRSGLLYLQPLICCSVTLTADANNNWCVILNILLLLKHCFVCILHVRERERERERVSTQCDSWCALVYQQWLMNMWV